MKTSVSVRISAIAAFLFMAEIASAQHVAFVQERPRNLLDMIFGGPRQAPPVSRDFHPPTPPAGVSGRPTQSSTPTIGGSASSRATGPASRPSAPASGGVSRHSGGGGSLAVCVRTCDGFFFPVNYEGARGSDRFAEACQASCPNAETEVYFKPPGADMHSAANAKGRNYTLLPNAFKYRTQRDATCSCKADGETWAQALKGAEELIGTRKGDTVVTQERSDQLTRSDVPNASPKPKDSVASAPAPKSKLE